VGYALMLAAIIGLILVSVALLGSSTDRAFSMASARMFAGADQAEPQRDTCRSNRNANPDIGKSVAAGANLERLALLAFAAVSTAVLAASGWTILRPSPKKRKDRTPPVPEQVVLERPGWAHLLAKREFLWRQLMADQDLLLKNRIEVRHVMTDDPVTVGRATPGKEIAELMSRHRLRYLPVCDEQMRFLGVVKRRDHQAHPDRRAGEIMTPPEASVTPSAAVGAAISLLIERGVSFLPVVDEERLRGVLTPTDLVLTLHCSLQIWFRVAQSMQTDSGRVEEMEATNRSIGEIVGHLGDRVRRLPKEVKSAIQTGNAAALTTELNETMASLSRLVRQVEEVQSQIKAHTSQMGELRDLPADAATGAASREELDRVLGRFMPFGTTAGRTLSVILYLADSCRRLRREKGDRAADAHLRRLAEQLAEHLEPTHYLCRSGEDTLTIVMPGASIDDARKFASRLSSAWPVPGDGPQSKPRMSVVSARRGETASDLLRRAEAALSPIVLPVASKS